MITQTSLLRRKCANDESHEHREKLMRQSSSASQAELLAVPPVVHDGLHSPGHPLDAKTRSYMEPRFGYDFGMVMVHTDAKAAESARTVNALAYTVGQDVVFREATYKPHTYEGRKVLAHELSHVVQQRHVIHVGGPLPITNPSDLIEQEADTVAQNILGGQLSYPLSESKSQLARRKIEFEIEPDDPSKPGLINLRILTPKDKPEYIENKIEAVGFGIYVGEYLLFCQGLEQPILVPEKMVNLQLNDAVAISDTIYQGFTLAERAMKTTAPSGRGDLTRYAYFRGGGSLIYPTIFSPATTPRVVQAMLDAKRELGQYVEKELTVLALSLLGAQMLKIVVGRLTRIGSQREYQSAETQKPKSSSEKSGVGESVSSTPDKKPLFYKPKIQGDPTLPKTEGFTNKYGDITYSTRGTAADVQLAKDHETVHSILSPKLRYFREFRANLGMTAHQKSNFLKYLEEALAETYGQLRLKGLKGLPDSIRFPVKNGYVVLSTVVMEAAVGIIVVGGTIFAVYLVSSE